MGIHEVSPNEYRLPVVGKDKTGPGQASRLFLKDERKGRPVFDFLRSSTNHG